MKSLRFMWIEHMTFRLQSRSFYFSLTLPQLSKTRLLRRMTQKQTLSGSTQQLQLHSPPLLQTGQYVCMAISCNSDYHVVSLQGG